MNDKTPERKTWTVTILNHPDSFTYRGCTKVAYSDAALVFTKADGKMVETSASWIIEEE